MKPCKIKICGLSRFSDILAVNQAGPDYIGFVFAKSSRQVSADKARQLKSELDTRIKAVGVFVNAPLEEILYLTGQGNGREPVIDMIQLHGDEDSSYIRKLKDHTDLPVIKALRVRDPEQILRAQELPCEYLLLDTYTANAYGGAGAGFDWSMIPELTKPFFLAGGISTDNLVQAASYRPYCIDVSSGAETQGRKDRMRIAQLVAMVRTINEYNECKGA